jgi:hypothetical protein
MYLLAVISQYITDDLDTVCADVQSFPYMAHSVKVETMNEMRDLRTKVKSCKNH